MVLPALSSPTMRIFGGVRGHNPQHVDNILPMRVSLQPVAHVHIDIKRTAIVMKRCYQMSHFNSHYALSSMFHMESKLQMTTSRIKINGMHFVSIEIEPFLHELREKNLISKTPYMFTFGGGS